MAPANRNVFFNFKNASISLVCSDDPYLKYEKTSALISMARQRLENAPADPNDMSALFEMDDEGVPFHLFTNTDFGVGQPNVQILEQELADPGFFSGKAIIKINLKDLDTIGVGVLQCIVERMRDNIHIIIDLPRINATLTKVPSKDPNALRSGKAKWPNSLESRKKDVISYLYGLGATVDVLYALEEAELKQWIVSTARTHHIGVNKEITEMIARSCDNNLMVISQTLRMMELAFIPNGDIPANSIALELTSEQVSNFFSKDARYTGHELPQAILTYDSVKALNIISSFCNGQESSKGTAIMTLLSVMDQALNVVYEGKSANVNWSNYAEKNRFFTANGVRSFKLFDTYIKAIKELDGRRLDFLSFCLAEASQAYSYFDNDGAIRALQRMALFGTNARAASFLRTTLRE